MTAHYSPSAYQPARIPDQPAAVKRSWLFHFGSSRLPWGTPKTSCRIAC